MKKSLSNEEFLTTLLTEYSTITARTAIADVDFNSIADRYETIGLISTQDRDRFIQALSSSNWHELLSRDLPKVIRDRVIPLLDEADRADLQNIPVGLALDFAYDGLADRNPGGGYVVLLNAGIITSFQPLVFALLALGTLDSDKPWSKAYDRPLLLNTFYRIGRSIHDSVSWLQGIHTKHYSDRPRPQAAVELYTGISEDFVMLHELAHILHGDVDRVKSWEFDALSVQKQNKDMRAMELAADRFAVERLLHTTTKHSTEAVAFAVAATLLLFDLGEYCFPNMPKISARTHPPGLQRWKNVRELLRQSENEKAMVDLVERTFNEVKASFDQTAIPPISANSQKTATHFRVHPRPSATLHA